jgi:hypothetical protein
MTSSAIIPYEYMMSIFSNMVVISYYVTEIPTYVTAYNIMDGVRSWSQLTRVKNSFTFIPIVPVDEFFKDSHDKAYLALRNHSLEQSPCYPIIGIKPVGRHTMYYCEICHPEFANDSAVANINLSCIEHHCKYRDPERHKAEIVSRLALIGCEVR